MRDELATTRAPDLWGECCPEPPATLSSSQLPTGTRAAETVLRAHVPGSRGTIVTSPVLTDRQGDRRTVELSITGMNCAACAARITKKLNDLGDVSASVNLATDTAVVTAPPEVSVADLLDAVERIGYRAEERRSSGAAGDGADENDRQVRRLGQRLIVAAVLFMPLCDASLAFSLVPSVRFAHWQWVTVLLAAPVVVWAAWPIHQGAIRAARHGTSTMDTLVSLGILASTGWSLYVMFGPSHVSSTTGLAVLTHPTSGALYLDVAAGVTTFLLAGRFYEAVAKRRAGDVLRTLAARGARNAMVVVADGSEVSMPVERLCVGDVFVVRSGEKIACDGVVLSGHGCVDRSLVTGESLPVDADIGDQVIGGTILAAGHLTIRRVGGRN